MMKSLYLITGNESYDKNEILENIKKEFGTLEKGINYIVLEQDSIGSLSSEINTYAFGYEKKLIVVKTESKQSTKEETKIEKNEILTPQLEEELATLEDSVCVVFVGEYAISSKLYKFVQKHGTCYVCDFKKENELCAWAKGLFQKEGITISNNDVSYMITLCGNQKQNLKNEIDKLISYAMDTKKITKEEIDALCIRNSEVIIFDLTDSLGFQNQRKGSTILKGFTR